MYNLDFLAFRIISERSADVWRLHVQRSHHHILWFSFCFLYSFPPCLNVSFDFNQVLTLLNYFINEYSPISWKGLHIFTWILNCFGMFFILAAHEHYSIDVFVAFCISLFFLALFNPFYLFYTLTFLYFFDRNQRYSIKIVYVLPLAEASRRRH